MGFMSNMSSRIRGYLNRDKSRVAMQISRGATNPSAGTFDLLQSYGQNALSEYLKVDQDILTRYVDYEEMDDYPEISAAIDIFADDASQSDIRRNRSIWVNSGNERIAEICNKLLHRTLRMDEEIWEIARTLTKKGNDFEEILVTEDGVRGLNFLPAETMRRIEGPRGELFGFIQDFTGKTGFTEEQFKMLLDRRMNPNDNTSTLGGSTGNADFDLTTALEHWEVTHFRLRGKHRRSVYGHSVLEPARWIWKRLTLLEDSALIYRLQRAPERFAFYVDVGDLPPQEALGWLNRVRQMHKKKKFVNPGTGKIDLKYETLSQDDDFYVPVRKGIEGTRIETLGAPQWQHMEDIEYFRDKLFAAIKIPRAYLGLEEGVVRAVLSSQDVRFARTVLRIQRELRNGMSKVCRVHLAALNIDPYSEEYDVEMTVPSSIFELAQMEALNARADLAARMGEFVSQHWVLSKIFNYSEDDIERIFHEKKEDAVRLAEYQAEAQAKMQDILGDAMQGQGMDPAAMAAGAVPPPAPGGAPPPPQPSPMMQSRGMPTSNSLFGSTNLIYKGRNGISERELFAGDREAEKRAEGKLEQLLKNDIHLAKKLQDVGDLLSDLKHATPRKGR